MKRVLIRNSFGMILVTVVVIILLSALGLINNDVVNSKEYLGDYIFPENDVAAFNIIFTDENGIILRSFFESTKEGLNLFSQFYSFKLIELSELEFSRIEHNSLKYNIDLMIENTDYEHQKLHIECLYNTDICKLTINNGTYNYNPSKEFIEEVSKFINI